MVTEQEIQRGLKLIQQIRDEAYVRNIEWELTSIEKFYRTQLYTLQKNNR